MRPFHCLPLCAAILLLVACAPMTPIEPTALAAPTSAPTLTATATLLPPSSPTVAPTSTATLPPATPTAVPPTATALPPTATPPPPTSTPSSPPPPTRTPLPPTLAPTTRPTTAPTIGACISYRDAAQFVGQTTCVSGNVSSTGQSGSTYFINFSASRDSFYAVSFNLNASTLPLTRGQCIKVSGTIELFNGRPQIVVRSTSQVTGC